MSEPGVGKSAILEDLRMEMGEDEYDFIYVDGPNKDMMDIAATIPNHETKSLEHYVASLFKMGNGKKKVIMIDEALKVPKLMQPIYTRLYQERTVGDEALPDGSMVFATTNNSSDGVGDNLQAHTANRVSIVRNVKAIVQRVGRVGYR
jgi:MoxR-like ATPase